MAKKARFFRKPQRSPAFTLMELLVVIAIIALLMSILTPALQRAKSLTRRVICGAQVRQMAFGAVMYAESNKDHFWKNAPYLNFVTANAYVAILNYTGLTQNAPEPDSSGNYTQEMKDYLHDVGQQLFLCPAYKVYKNMQYLPAFAARSEHGWGTESAWNMGYISLVGFDPKVYTTWDWTSAIKTTDKPLGRPGDDPSGRLPLFADFNNQGLPYVRAAHTQKGSAIFVNAVGATQTVTPIDYGMAGTNIAFIDGSVEWRQASETRSHRPGFWW